MSSVLLDRDAPFSMFGLDRRLTKAVAKLGFVHPTLVQSKFLPLAMKGKDLLVRARTGSGKTLAYVLPILEKVLREKSSRKEKVSASGAHPLAIVLVPSHALVSQTRQVFASAMHFCSDVISVVGLADQTMGVQRMYLLECPDILVCTPGKLLSHLEAGHLHLEESVSTLVLDEADLILSYGGGGDIRNIAARLPKICQTFLMSATLSPELDDLRQVILHKPAVLKLEEGGEGSTDGLLSQFFVSIGSDDRELLLYGLLKLRLVTGKIIFFVNSVNRCYELKLLLEQFAVKSAVLNAELPSNSRAHILEQFNRGVFDHLIATDESLVEDEEEEEEEDDEEPLKEEEEEEEEKPEGEKNDNDEEGGEERDYGPALPTETEKAAMEADEKQKRLFSNAKKSSSKTSKSGGGEYARGIDFKGVTAVVNFDFPLTVASYTHRIGRTARGGASGTALSFVADDDRKALSVLEEIQLSQPQRDGQMQPQRLPLDISELENMRYRVADVRRAVTRVAVREARLKELKQELINSEKLQAHFEDNPEELSALQHDAFLQPKRVQPHMAHVPDYLLPTPLRGNNTGIGAGKRKVSKMERQQRAKQRYEAKRKRIDPLQGIAVSREQLADVQVVAKRKKRKRQGEDLNAVRPVHDAGVSTSGRRKWKERHGKTGRRNKKGKGKHR